MAKLAKTQITQTGILVTRATEVCFEIQTPGPYLDTSGVLLCVLIYYQDLVVSFKTIRSLNVGQLRFSGVQYAYV